MLTEEQEQEAREFFYNEQNYPLLSLLHGNVEDFLHTLSQVAEDLSKEWQPEEKITKLRATD